MRSFLLAIAAVILLIPAGMMATTKQSGNQTTANRNTPASAQRSAVHTDTSFAFLKEPIQKDIQLKPNRTEAVCILECPNHNGACPCNNIACYKQVCGLP